MKKLAGLIAVVFCCLGLKAQDACLLKGMITDSDGPVAGAYVILVHPSGERLSGAVSGVDGAYCIRNIPAGDYSLRVKMLGYESIEQAISITASEQLLDFTLLASSLDMPTVNIIASNSEVQKTLPGTATHIDKQTNELIQPMGTQEMLQQVPGVHGFSDDGMGNSRISIGIRGLNPRRSSRVLFMEDGIPIAPALYVYPNMYYNPPAERIDEYEIIKGAAAIKYGPQTMGGVINYITRRPSRELGGEVNLTAGTNNYRSIFARTGGWGNEFLHPEIQLLYKGGSGFRDNNAFNQFNGTFKLNILSGTKDIIFIKANVDQEFNQATYTGLTEYSFRTNPTFNPKDDDFFRIRRYAFDLIYTHEVNDRLMSTTKFYLNHFDRRWWREYDVFVTAEDFNDGGEMDPVPWYTEGDLVRVGNGQTNFGILRRFYVGGVEHGYDWSWGSGNFKGNLETGARLHYERFLDDRVEGDSPDDRDGDFIEFDSTSGEYVAKRSAKSTTWETTALSAYVLNKFIIKDKFYLVPGVRAELFEQEQIDKMTGSKYTDNVVGVVLPGLGLNYEWKKFNFFGGVHRGYTPPSSGAFNVWQFTPDTSGFDLEAEKSWNYEAGFRFSNKWIAWESAGFFLDIEDMLAAGRGTAFRNLSRVQTYGIEHAMSIDPAEKFSRLWFLPEFHLSYTFLKTRILGGEILSSVTTGYADVSGNVLPYAPEHAWTAGITWKVKKKFLFRADAQYVDLVYTDFENIKKYSNRGDQGPIPSYMLFNASIAWKVNKHWTISATGKNLTDEIYIGSRLHSNPRQPEASSSSGILPGARRQVNLSVNYTFGKK